MNHTPAPGPKYKTGRDTWAFRLFGQMRGCQSAELRCMTAFQFPPAARPKRSAKDRNIGRAIKHGAAPATPKSSSTKNPTTANELPLFVKV